MVSQIKVVYIEASLISCVGVCVCLEGGGQGRVAVFLQGLILSAKVVDN